MARFSPWLSWRRIAVAGLVALLGAMVLGSMLPDPEQLAPDELADLASRGPRVLAVARAVPAGRLLGSPWLVLVPLVLAVAIVWNLVDRIAAHRGGPPAVAPRFAPQAEWDAEGPPEPVAAALAARLARRRYRVFAHADPDGGRTLVARRGAMGFWGSVAFHVGLVVALAAITATLFGAWRGLLHLVEHDDVALDAPGAVSIQRSGPLSPALAHTVLQLAKCDVRYQDDWFPVDYRADLVALEPSGRLRDVAVRVNAPAEVDGARLLLHAFGIAPVLVVDRGAERLAAAPVSVSVREGREDVVDIPGTRDQLAVRWFGDVVRQGRSASSRSDLPRNPALGLRFRPPGAPEISVLLRRGEAATIGPYRVAFPEVRYWIDLVVEGDPGAPLLAAAFAIGAIGLAIRFWDYEREVRVRVSAAGEGSRISASARSRYFPALIARELERLCDAR